MPQGVRLHIPFPPRISPDAERARRVHIDWPRSYGLLSGAAAERRHEMGAYADVAARFHPAATGDDLDLAVDQQSWFFLFDDLFDEPTGQDPGRVRELVGDVSSVLDGSGPPRHPLARAFADLWARSVVGMSGRWQARAAANWRAYLGGYLSEALTRGGTHRPAFNDHFAVRTRTIGALPVLDMAERVGHYECPDRAFSSPLLKELRRLAVEVVILDNDIVSVEKEEAIGDVNLVLLLQAERRCSRAAALDLMCTMVEERTNRFTALEPGLSALAASLGPDDASSEILRRYDHDALRTLMRGAYDWDQHAERYGGEFARTQATAESWEAQP